MTDKTDGGPAFPHQPIYNNIRDEIYGGANGMTLRDWFAGQALAHLDDDGAFDERAQWAYALADAMLAERGRDK